MTAKRRMWAGVVAMLLGQGGLALAEETADSAGSTRRAWSIMPRVTVQEIITDNVVPGAAVKTGDQITEVSPGVRLEGNTARVKMHLDYSLRGQYYAQGSRGSTTQNALNAVGTVEAIEKLLFVDMSGAIAQQNISAFGTPSPATYSINANATETSNFRLSPYLKGRLGGYAGYEARYSRSAVRAKSAAASDSDISEWLGRLTGETPYAALGWGLDANRRNYNFSLGRKSESEQWRGQLSYRLNPQLKLSVSAGGERNDFVALTSQSWNTGGYGADWTPGERTQVSAFREKRFFGYGHTINISHRMPLSAVKYTDSRDISALPSQLATTGLGNIYDLLFAQMASSIPDATARAAYVTALLNSSGIDPNAPATAGFLSSQVTVQRSQQLSWLLRGVRNMVTLALVRTRNDRLGLGLGNGDDFSAASSIVQKGFNVGWSYQLSALSSINVMGARTQGVGMGTGLAQTTQKTLSAGISTKLGAKTNAALTARRTEAESSVAPYTENAVVGSVSLQF